MKVQIEIKEINSLIKRIEFLEIHQETILKLFNNHSLLLNNIEDKIGDLEKKDGRRSKS